MRKILSYAAVSLLVGVVLVGVACSRGGGSSIKIESAHRAEKVAMGSYPHAQELTAVHPETYAVLDLRLGGISVEEFQAIDRDSIFIEALGDVYRPMVTQSGVVSGKKMIRLCVIVPRDVTRMMLHLGSKYEKMFTADEKISSILKD